MCVVIVPRAFVFVFVSPRSFPPPNSAHCHASLQKSQLGLICPDNNNNNNNHLFYIALLKSPEVALQSPESSSHTHTVIPVVVSYISRLTEAWQPISAYGPSDHYQHSFTSIRTGLRLGACLNDGGGNRSNRSKPTQTRGEHANSTQKGPGATGIRTQGLLAVRRQC